MLFDWRGTDREAGGVVPPVAFLGSRDVRSAPRIVLRDDAHDALPSLTQHCSQPERLAHERGEEDQDHSDVDEEERQRDHDFEHAFVHEGSLRRLGVEIDDGEDLRDDEGEEAGDVERVEEVDLVGREERRRAKRRHQYEERPEDLEVGLCAWVECHGTSVCGVVKMWVSGKQSYELNVACECRRALGHSGRCCASNAHRRPPRQRA